VTTSDTRSRELGTGDGIDGSAKFVDVFCSHGYGRPVSNALAIFGFDASDQKLD
jgi:hypothetical protein